MKFEKLGRAQITEDNAVYTNIRGVSATLWLQLRLAALRDGRPLVDVLNDAIKAWLEARKGEVQP